MFTPSRISAVLERQLLLQLGDRLRRLRVAQGLGTVEMAARVDISRNTLRAVESGDPAPSLGTYLRVMSVLGVSGDLALLAGDIHQPAPAGSAAARSRRSRLAVEVRVSINEHQHKAQDLQSLALHEEAVRLCKSNPALVFDAIETLKRWLRTGDSHSINLWREWEGVLKRKQWPKILGRSARAKELRQASPLVTVLPDEARRRVLEEVKSLKAGVSLCDPPVGNSP